VLRAIVDRLFFPEQETTSRLLAYWRRTISGKRELKAAQRAEQPIGVLDGARPVYLPDPPRITPPRATYQPGPLYNDEVRRQGMSGQVIVNVIVNERGDTEALEIEKSAGETMDSATIQKLSQWRFAPGHRRGVPVAAILRVKVNFSIVPPKTH
jgi:TonB family protein